MSTTPRLSICLPSHAPMAIAHQTLDNVRDLCRLECLEVIVSDNSNDANKEVRLSAMSSPSFRYLKSSASNAIGNWTNALRHASGELACFLSDDDLLMPMPGFSPEVMDVPSDVIGIRPQMALYTEATGIYAHTNFDITEVRAIDRVRAYFERNGGANTTLFSCFRRTLLQDMLYGIDEFHPTRAGYIDWSIVIGLISSGPLLADRRLLYVYNNRNWAHADDIARNTVKTFVDSGLPADAAQILQPLSAIDSFAAICRASSPISVEEKLEAGWYTVQSYFDSFVLRLRDENFAKSLAPARYDIAATLARDARTPVEKLAASLLLVEEWLPGRGDAYQVYFRETLDRDILLRL
jgi:hypothetical protein